jgi:hypothetical protein
VLGRLYCLGSREPYVKRHEARDHFEFRLCVYVPRRVVITTRLNQALGYSRSLGFQRRAVRSRRSGTAASTRTVVRRAASPSVSLSAAIESLRQHTCALAPLVERAIQIKDVGDVMWRGWKIASASCSERFSSVMASRPQRGSLKLFERPQALSRRWQAFARTGLAVARLLQCHDRLPSCR